MSDFPWLAKSNLPTRHAPSVPYRNEIASRAALYFRLGYPPSRAIARLSADADWQFESTPHIRPSALSPKAITDVVKATYLRRPKRR